MDLAVRAFGLSSWSLLVPQVLMGVGAVALLWATVRRPFGPLAGLLAGASLAVVPVAASMFRFDSPDALLVLLMIAAGWAMTRAVEDGRWRWLLLCGGFVGFGVLAAQLQALLVVPALVSTYLLAGPPPLRIRIAQLGAAAGAMVVTAGWWIVLAGLWPTSSRPYFGGTQHNSIVELIFGDSGLGSLDGTGRPDGLGLLAGTGPIDGSGPTSGLGPLGSMRAGSGGVGDAGITRLFEPAQGGLIAWLIPAAVIVLVAGLVLCGKSSRSDQRRAALVLWGGWLIVIGLVFSFDPHTFAEHSALPLAPAIAALVGAGGGILWQHRDRTWVPVTAAAVVAATTATAWMLLSRNASFLPWLRWALLVGGIAVTVGLLFAAPRRFPARRRFASALAVAAALVATAGPFAYTADTLTTAHIGNAAATASTGDAVPTSSPSERLTALLDRDGEAYTWAAATVGASRAAGYQLATQLPVMAIGGATGTDPAPTLDQFRDHVAALDIHYFIPATPGAAEKDSAAAQITAWVENRFTSQNVDGVTLYDLTAPK